VGVGESLGVVLVVRKNTVKQESFEAGNFCIFTILDDFVAGNFHGF